MNASKKIAIIVQRAGKDIVGGSEKYALEMGIVLSKYFDVELLTTTAQDHVTWKNVYPEGTESLSSTLRIKRFPVDFERGRHWFEFDSIINKYIGLSDFPCLSKINRDVLLQNIRRLPISLCEVWEKEIGPYSSSLLSYLKNNNNTYYCFIFMTYLYPTTYFGIDNVTGEKIYFIPTFHDELPAYLPIFHKYKIFHHLFLTSAERKIVENNIYMDNVEGDVIGLGIKDRYCAYRYTDKNIDGKYILFAGRLEEAKGVLKLYKLFDTFYAENKCVKLYTIGNGILKNYKHEGVIHKGHVDEEEKLFLMRNALAFVHPSACESLSIVLLESFMMGKPALVNRKSEVLFEHIQKSKAGFSYEDYGDFKRALFTMINKKSFYENLCKNARKYFLCEYSLESYKQKLLKLF